ncbi:MAG: hydrogenase maturation protease [Candidatus Melainabacteria bacterium]|nr:hydrogenase maturation protease [Candidatus Melainabacteria bacterium]
MLTIIGCGNANRNDDRVGVYVVNQLRERLADLNRDDVRIFDAGTSGMDVMFQAKGSSALIIIDANRSGAEPGAIFEVPGDWLANIPEPSFNLHNFRWDHAIYAGQKMYKDQFPQDITVYLIEAQDLGLGLEMTAPVETAAGIVIEKIIKRLREGRQT